MNYGYIRVSTDRQAMSPEVQRQTVEATASRMGLRIDGWFQDAPVQKVDGSWNDAVSGKVHLGDRTAGKELVARLKTGDTVFVAKVDRAFRKLSDCVLMLDRWERVGGGADALRLPRALINRLLQPLHRREVSRALRFGSTDLPTIERYEGPQHVSKARTRTSQPNSSLARPVWYGQG
jgi:hypothetical protein